jgi:hypothetical protein
MVTAPPRAGASPANLNPGVRLVLGPGTAPSRYRYRGALRADGRVRAAWSQGARHDVAGAP